VACLASTTLAHAEAPLKFGFSSPGAHERLKDATLYEIKMTCKSGRGLSPDSTNVLQNIANFFAHQNQSANQYIIIGNDAATPDPSDVGKVKLPDKAIAIIPVFSIKDRSVVANFAACQKSIYVQASAPIYLIPTVAWSSSYTEGAGLAALYQATKLISPIWSLFNPASIPAAVTKTISNVQATEDPIKGILAQMNTDQNYGESRRLRSGRYVIETSYSTVTLDVAPLPSIVAALSDDLRQSFRAALDAAPQKIPTANFQQTCSQVADGLKKSGFSEDQDIPYALGWLAGNALESENDVIHCLGRDYAVKAARLGPILWSLIRESKRVSEMDAAMVYPPTDKTPLQPDFSSVVRVIDNLVRDLSRIAKNRDPKGGALPQFIAGLKADIEPTVIVNDNTVAAVFAGTSTADAQKVGDLFVGNGYYRFGCYAQITDKFGINTDGAVAMLLSFKLAANAPPPATVDSIVGVRPLFGKDGLVSQFTFTDSQQAIAAALDANGWNCNGFAVKKPATN